MKRAFITGITGQDGSYLADILLDRGYEVHGLVHTPDKLKTSLIRHIAYDPDIIDQRLFLYPGSLEEIHRLIDILNRVKPDELYHLAGVSSPRLSLQFPIETLDSIGMATLKLLEALRQVNNPPRILFASSSEAFGSPPYAPQDEMVPLNPSTPYGAAKAFAMQMGRIYRTAYGLQTCSAILFNHESPRRSDQFVTMKIAKAAARIKNGKQKVLKLGNLSGRRDWGWAPDYVDAMWRMLQMESVDDFVIATGKLHSVEDVISVAFGHVGLSWNDYVEHSPGLTTKVEPMALCGNPSKAARLLDWKAKVSFEETICRMVDSEMDKATRPPFTEE